MKVRRINIHILHLDSPTVCFLLHVLKPVTCLSSGWNVCKSVPDLLKLCHGLPSVSSRSQAGPRHPCKYSTCAGHRATDGSGRAPTFSSCCLWLAFHFCPGSSQAAFGVPSPASLYPRVLLLSFRLALFSAPSFGSVRRHGPAVLQCVLALHPGLSVPRVISFRGRILADRWGLSQASHCHVRREAVSFFPVWTRLSVVGEGRGRCLTPLQRQLLSWVVNEWSVGL